ncbi:hypothetical protein N0V95_007579 [Ascochyta clinopodiicola]|nr:hypothetical protein N0V95_007579 [Ascochyta clinopodiicola]
MVSHTQAQTGEFDLLTRQRVSQLLRPMSLIPPIRIEEDWHPWSVKNVQKLDFPLMRIWDICSGSNPDEDSRMLSRAPNEVLNTKEARKDSLAFHLDHGNWTIPTPYVSFTSSAHALKELAHKRETKGNRGTQTLTVIDPSTRIKNGLPTLDVAAEMKHYSIPDPYDQGNQYYVNHYVCLWEVTPDEVVGHWGWDELAGLENWYENVIMPEFDRFRTGEYSVPASPIATAPISAPASVPATALTFDMSALRQTLPG